MRSPSLLQAAAVAASFYQTVSATCDCGYSVNSSATDPGQHRFAVFTDYVETDFLHVGNVSDVKEWQAQKYNVTMSDARGPYGKIASPDNVVANPLKDSRSWAGASQLGGDAGLQIWSRASTVDSMLPMGELVTSRNDMLHGSYRVGMKLTSVRGTCGAFFWFRNNSQEVDMEFLSRQFGPDQNSVNLVLQSPASAAAGYDASKTEDFVVYSLPFAPDQAYHEYRFDWLADRVSFYADGQWLKDMTQNVPSAPGHLVLNHWSNGDHAWSGGPPDQDAVLTVSYVKAYFNRSGEAGNQLYGDNSYSRNCPSASDSAKKICQIPDQTVAPDLGGPDGNTTAHTFFFSKPDDPIWTAGDGGNGTDRPHKNGAGSAQSVGVFSRALTLFLFLAAFCSFV